MFIPLLRQFIILVIAAGVGALVALALRSALHRPYELSSPDRSPDNHAQARPTTALP